MYSSDDNLRKIQICSLNVLKDFDVLCSKENLQYYLAEGTLLGGVRHRGFIPWDDDIDVCMPRGDFDKLISVAKENMDSHYEISNMVDDDLWGVIRISDINHSLKRFFLGRDILYHVNIDVFPIDGLPKKRIIRLVHMIRVFINYYFFRITELKNVRLDNKSGPVKLLIMISKAIPFYKLIDKEHALNRLVNSLKKYNYEDCEYVWSFFSAYKMNALVSKSCFGKGKRGCFESCELVFPDNPDAILKANYGDYMKLPPEEERKSKHDVRIVY